MCGFFFLSLVLVSPALLSISHVLTLLWVFIACFRICNNPHHSPWPFLVLPAAVAHSPLDGQHTNIFNTIHWCYLWRPWSRVFQGLFLILTVPCEVVTCMLSHSTLLPGPSLGRWVSCRGQRRVTEPLLKNIWGTWGRSQEDTYPLEAETNLPIANVIQTTLTGSATEKVTRGMTRDKKQLYLFRKGCGYFRDDNQPVITDDNDNYQFLNIHFVPRTTPDILMLSLPHASPTPTLKEDISSLPPTSISSSFSLFLPLLSFFLLSSCPPSFLSVPFFFLCFFHSWDYQDSRRLGYSIKVTASP